MKQELESLKRVGGTEWQKNGMHRIYFNNLAEWYGLKVNRYNSGNVSSATLDGEEISNGRAKKIAGRLDYAKFWYDVITDRFAGRDIDQADMDVIVDAIKAAAVAKAA